MNLFQSVADVLKTDSRFFSTDGIFLRNAVYEAAMQMDAELLKLLFSNSITKRRFFKEVNGFYIFDKVDFSWVINNKQFLPDSYTRYKNKIGLLTPSGEYISESKDVELVFPYKDCVLEGGQKREDEKRKEIFYNEKLSSDNVDRLLAPKVFTKAKRFSVNGYENSICFNQDDNLVIKGNNLLALASLLKRYEGKVNLIYIDPPYNTGNDSFKYNDSFNHSTWLTFMKNRLELAKKLLAPNGSIYVQIDSNESAYLKVLMDEVFENNFKAEIIWVLKGASGFKSLSNNYVRGHDSILFYTRSKEFLYNKCYLPYGEDQLKRFSSIDEHGRKYKPITKVRRMYLDEAKGIPLTDVWDDIASFQTVVNSNEITGFSTQKPEKLMQRIIECSSNKGDIVLDFHGGSGTTASAAMKLGRRFITIEQMDYVEDILLKRLEDVVLGKQSGISKATGYLGGGTFVYCELAELNQKYVSEINQAQTDSEILKLLESILNTSFISHYIDPKDIATSTDEFNELPLEDKKRLLMELLDKNQLYINYCDIDDETFNITAADKEFTRSFYGD